MIEGVAHGTRRRVPGHRHLRLDARVEIPEGIGKCRDTTVQAILELVLRICDLACELATTQPVELTMSATVAPDLDTRVDRFFEASPGHDLPHRLALSHEETACPVDVRIRYVKCCGDP